MMRYDLHFSVKKDVNKNSEVTLWSVFHSFCNGECTTEEIRSCKAPVFLEMPTHKRPVGDVSPEVAEKAFFTNFALGITKRTPWQCPC